MLTAGLKVRGKRLKGCITRQGSVCAPLPSRHAHSFVAACARRRFTCGWAGARASAEQRGRRAGVGLPSGFRTLGGSSSSCSWPIPHLLVMVRLPCALPLEACPHAHSCAPSAGVAGARRAPSRGRQERLGAFWTARGLHLHTPLAPQQVNTHTQVVSLKYFRFLPFRPVSIVVVCSTVLRARSFAWCKEDKRLSPALG